MKKISLIFKDDADADDWLKAARKHSILLLTATEKAVIKVSTRKVKKGKAAL